MTRSARVRRYASVRRSTHRTHRAMPRCRKPGVHGSRRSRQSGAPVTRLAANPWSRTPHGGPVANTRSIGVDRIRRRAHSAVRGVSSTSRLRGSVVCACNQRRTRPLVLIGTGSAIGSIRRAVASRRPPRRRVVAHDFDRRRQAQRRRIGRVPCRYGAGEDDRLPPMVGQMQREAIRALAADVVERRKVARDDQDPAQPPVSKGVGLAVVQRLRRQGELSSRKPVCAPQEGGCKGTRIGTEKVDTFLRTKNCRGCKPARCPKRRAFRSAAPSGAPPTRAGFVRDWTWAASSLRCPGRLDRSQTTIASPESSR